LLYAKNDIFDLTDLEPSIELSKDDQKNQNN